MVGPAVPKAGGTTLANPGFSLAELPAPVVAVDTVHVITEVTHARESVSRPETGTVTFEHRGSGQRDELARRTRRAAR